MELSTNQLCNGYAFFTILYDIHFVISEFFCYIFIDEFANETKADTQTQV